ncbi:MAG TPA: ATP-binding protein [Pyrinomonadaceae bacterium]|jgi:two-component system sensor histidine kinase PilS (NtrC family)|nr:ATP-binding protein [Pyrinomonadaceae bacterium]
MGNINSLSDSVNAVNSLQTQRVQTLIIGRLIVTFLILVTSWIWYSGSTLFTLQSIPQNTLLIFIITVGLTGAYFLLLRIGRALQWQVRFQFLIDALMVTWLVWRSGDLTSPYISLYIVVIAVSGIYLRPASAVAMSLLCTALYAGLSFLTYYGFIESDTLIPIGKLAQTVSFHSVAFIIVGFLSAKLADRRFSGEALQQATRTIASLRQLHERIIESIRSGLITTDQEGIIYTFNSAAAEITGFRADEMRGRSIFSLFTEIEQDLEKAANESAQLQSRYETHINTPDGFRVRIGYSISKLFSEAGEATGYIITFQDLTEISSIEENIRRKDRLAAVGRLSAGLAHEIRNPLGAMRGAIQLLKSTTPPDSVHSDLMGIILRESDRLNSIITNFLSYAKPQVGNFIQIDVCEVIRDTLKLVRHSPDIRENHEITEKLPLTPIIITADQTQLQQVFWNLSRNAIQAMPDGGRLEVTVEKIHSNRIRIVFTDNGCGMPPEKVERLFEPFTTSTTGGTGLGLSIVYQIVRDHKGTITVSSSAGEGTSITIELPVTVTPSAKQEEAKADETAEAENSPIKAFLNVKNEE